MWFFVKGNFPDHFLQRAVGSREKRALRHRRTFKCLYPPPRNKKRKEKSLRKEKKCNEESRMCWRIEIFLDMSSHCVTNIWEWSRGKKGKILQKSCLTFPKSSWHRQKIWILAFRVNKIEDKVSWYQITFRAGREKMGKSSEGRSRIEKSRKAFFLHLAPDFPTCRVCLHLDARREKFVEILYRFTTATCSFCSISTL